MHTLANERRPDGSVDPAPASRRGQGLRRLGWMAIAFFTLKGLLWLALAAGAWKLLDG